MRTIRPLELPEITALEKGFKTGLKHYFRQRCLAILLSHEGNSITAIAKQLKKKRDTISDWLDRYEQGGIDHLHNRPGSGVKAPLDSITKKQQEQVEKEVEKDPQNLSKVAARLGDLFNFKVTKWSLTRYLKKNSITHGVESEKD